jgi:hypothetical protein
MPLAAALLWLRLARSAPIRGEFALLRRALRARGRTARLVRVEFRGCLSAALVYDRQPIVDHFRRIDAIRMLGVMQARSASPYFFLLTAED